MPSSETIELIHLNRHFGKFDDVPSSSATSSLLARIRTILLNLGNIPIMRLIYGGGNSPDTSLTLDPFINVSFSDGEFLYISTALSPSKIYKIDLSTFTLFDTLTLGAGENGIRSIFSDGSNIYVACFTSPVKIAKINIATFTETSVLTLGAGEDLAFSIYSDGSFLYVALLGAPGRIVKVDLITFTEVSVLTTVVSNLSSLAISDRYIYAASSASTFIEKIDIDTFTTVSTLDVSPTAFFSGSLFIAGKYLYVAAGAFGAGRVVKVDLDTFTVFDTLTLNAGEGLNIFSRLLFSDGTNLFVALSPDVTANIAIISLVPFKRIGTITLSGGTFVNSIFVDETFLYAVVSGGVGVVHRKYLIPSNNAKDKQLDLIYEQTSTGTYYIKPSNAIGVLVTPGAGLYVKGLYVEIIAVNTVTTNFYIDSIHLDTQTANLDFEIDIATGLAGSEVIIATVSNMVSDSSDGREYSFNPQIKIPANTRISVRCSDSVGAGAVRVKIRYRI